MNLYKLDVDQSAPLGPRCKNPYTLRIKIGTLFSWKQS
jgi:hypothetical protein